ESRPCLTLENPFSCSRKIGPKRHAWSPAALAERGEHLDRIGCEACPVAPTRDRLDREYGPAPADAVVLVASGRSNTWPQRFVGPATLAHEVGQDRKDGDRADNASSRAGIDEAAHEVGGDDHAPGWRGARETKGPLVLVERQHRTRHPESEQARQDRV